MRLDLRLTASFVVLFPALALIARGDEAGLWALKPVARPVVPAGLTASKNPIDAFIAAGYEGQGLQPVGPADRRTLLRRVYLDLIGLPPTPEEQRAFLQDRSPDAYEREVDRLLASEQHGVRYGRHWLDVLRYADVDEGMIAARGIHLWRDWVINALNDDVGMIEEVVRDMTYKRPDQWFKYIDRRLSLGCPDATSRQNFTR